MQAASNFLPERLPEWRGKTAEDKDETQTLVFHFV